ncbi:MAG: hypothetical protein HQK96_15700 [Nitrospirae bacterium]|nr:hypothetical protein [Nitrospirota bacterium]
MDINTIKIGQRIIIVPVTLISNNIWRAICPALLEGWSCQLKHRSSVDIIPNTPLTVWVLNIEQSNRYVFASDSNFGFLPISDRMRPRYVISLKHVANAIQKNIVNTADAEHFSEVKGMFSRCFKLDQWDWRAVQLIFGEPSHTIAQKFATTLGEIATALRLENREGVVTGLELLNFENLPLTLNSAVQKILDSVPSISINSTKNSRSRTGSNKTIRSVLSQYSKMKFDVANATHAEILDFLISYLELHGHRIETNQFIDAFTRLKSGPAIFEAKSVTEENELSQVRHGLIQLYEYRFRHKLKDASLWLLLSREPKEKWLIEYIEHDRGICLLWIKDGQLSGPSLERLLESGSDFLRRK